MRALIRERWNGTLLVCGGYAPANAAADIAAGKIDCAVFGRQYIANPDLVARIAADGPYNTPDPDTFYGGGDKGYTDYPTLSEEQSEAA